VFVQSHAKAEVVIEKEEEEEQAEIKPEGTTDEVVQELKYPKF
jgi:hypothetical protein